MRNITIIASAIFTLLTYSCTLSETGTSRRPTGGEAWTNPSFSDSTSASGVCYIIGLDYPEGYDWKADSQTGSIKCSLVVFADGRLVMKIPVGNEYHVSPDPDMHRMLEGHLYTDFSTSSETIIKKDGTEIFRYGGREMILGMTISDGNVYTLGCPREGDGFTYRMNGEILLERNTGRAFPRLINDRDSIWFAYTEPIESADRRLERYHQVVNGKSVQIAIREDITKVWDAVRHQGILYYLADLTGISSPVVVSETGMVALEASKNMKILAGNLIPAGGSMAVEALYSGIGSAYASGIWKDGKKLFLFSNGMTVCGICTDDDGICCVSNPGPDSKNGIIFRSGEKFAMPEGFISMSRNATASVNGILNIGLSSLSGKKPVLWKDGITEEIDINGMICSISVE